MSMLEGVAYNWHVCVCVVSITGGRGLQLVYDMSLWSISLGGVSCKGHMCLICRVDIFSI